MRDRALTIDELDGLLRVLERDWGQFAGDPSKRFEVATLGAVLVIGFAAGLRGEELGLCRLAETFVETGKGLRHNRLPHVLVALEGKFKGVLGRKEHRFPLVPESSSGVLHIKVWLLRLLREYSVVHKARREGPLFRVTPASRSPATIAELNVLFHSSLPELQEERPNLLDPEIDVQRDFSLKRSLRRGSQTHALNRGIHPDVIDRNNRWRKHERARNREPTLTMQETYTDVRASLEFGLRYSRDL